MAIKFIDGNLFDSGCMIWVNTVNCEGVMGKGIALEFKKRFPEMFKEYKVSCKNNEVRVGKIGVHKTYSLLDNPKYIFNFPTKVLWRNSSKLEYIEQGLIDLVFKLGELNGRLTTVKDHTKLSIAIPALGCSNGGLDWMQVSSLMNKVLTPISDEIIIEIYKPHED
jgi:O-acetyl-ADP-ribose deacetylase (regulator of RNase III)